LHTNKYMAARQLPYKAALRLAFGLLEVVDSIMIVDSGCGWNQLPFNAGAAEVSAETGITISKNVHANVFKCDIAC
jgi:hypothetical protein